jgi:hypothetical protein
MACSSRVRKKAAQLRRIDIPRVVTARIIEGILIAMAGREETESGQSFDLCSRNECGRGAEILSEIATYEC